MAIARAPNHPTVLFADEPTGNLEFTTSGEIDLLQDSLRHLRPDDRDGHLDAHAGPAIAADPLPRRRPDQPGTLTPVRRDILEVMGRGEQTMIEASHSEGLLGRKLRTFLTALSGRHRGRDGKSGSYVLTDTMQKAF